MKKIKRINTTIKTAETLEAVHTHTHTCLLIKIKRLNI